MTGTCLHGWTFAHTCPTQPAPDLSDYERGVVARIDAAEAAPESYFVRRIVAEELRWAATEVECRLDLDMLKRRADALDPPS